MKEIITEPYNMLNLNTNISYKQFGSALAVSEKKIAAVIEKFSKKGF